ncbi:MAG TPA: hypothetical protein VFV52_15285 [Bacilli bacterium]|nr:hypothetical protein [Bacilli bacterium]
MKIKVWMGMLLGSFVLAGVLSLSGLSAGTPVAEDDPIDPSAMPTQGTVAIDDPIDPSNSTFIG